MAAVSSVALTWVVVRADPAQFTTEVGTNRVPVTVRVNPTLPSITLLGESVVSVGAGLFVLRATVCVPTESLMERVADWAWLTVGVNFTVRVQSQPALRLVPQADVELNSLGSVPVT